ncbi:MAG: hypothetical protein CO187_06235 [Zetaproteobacteria bacterium CG_4_9_14_3_um_filter_53_7]|nr:MAG: hypothetical protein CO187_06235 [Zetaproteobacteria bacterium CG_4_9_14_3_um_filter_53_7]
MLHYTIFNLNHKGHEEHEECFQQERSVKQARATPYPHLFFVLFVSFVVLFYKQKRGATSAPLYI